MHDRKEVATQPSPPRAKSIYGKAGPLPSDNGETDSAMAQRIVVYWRDIPAQVIVRQGRATAKRELPERFIQAIDRAAMRVGARDSDTYLAQWRRGAAEACGNDLEAEADATLATLIAEYDRERLDRLVLAGGHDRLDETE